MHEARVRARARMLPRAFVEEVTGSGDDDATAQAAVAGLVVSPHRGSMGGGGLPLRIRCRRGVAPVQKSRPGTCPRGRSWANVLDAIAVGGIASAPTVAERLLSMRKASNTTPSGRSRMAVYESSWNMREWPVLRGGGTCADARGMLPSRTRDSLESPAGHTRRNADRRTTGDVTMLLADIGCARIDATKEPCRSGRGVANRQSRGRNMRSSRTFAPWQFTIALWWPAQPVTSRRPPAAHTALQLCEVPLNRDRILFDIGENLRRLGLREASRDAFLLLSCTARDQSSRWHALILLMRIAGDDDAEVVSRVPTHARLCPASNVA